jgi:hypothetical protein
MTQFVPGVKREDLAPAQDPGEGKGIAEEAARRLADAYGDRLRQGVLFGSWARGQAHEESDVSQLRTDRAEADYDEPTVTTRKQLMKSQRPSTSSI